MNEIMEINVNSVVTMSSLEIAELTGKNHADVLRDIRNMFTGLNLGESTFAGTYKSSQNKYLPCFNLPKRETLILVSGYSIELRARIIDRWQELENQVKQPQLPTTYLEALKALVVSEEQNVVLTDKNLQLEKKIEEDKPKLLLAETLLSLEDGDGLIKPKDFAKAIESIYGIGRNTLYQILRDIKVWNKDNIPYARFVQAKYFSVKNGTFYNKYTKQEEDTVVVFITPKGRQYLVGKLNNLFDTEEI